MKQQKSGWSPMDHALSYLGARDRTEYEMRAYLDRQMFGETDIDDTIERLKELGLIDDRAYAERFVSTRLATKPVSAAHLKRQLLEHRVDPVYIDDALCALPDDAEQNNAIEIAQKFFRQFAVLEPEERKQRVLRRLTARRFGYDVCVRAYEAVVSETEEEA